MSATRIAAIALIVAGILGLIYGGFSFTSDTHEASIGPVEISVEEKQNVNIPIWAGVGAIVVGAGIVGAACAEALARAGCHVTVLESAFAGAGATGAAMGHLVVMDDGKGETCVSPGAVRQCRCGWSFGGRSDFR